MKKIIATLLLAACTASAQPQYIDLTTRVTNVVTTTGSRLTVTNHFTNTLYVAVNSNSVTIGDPLATAFTKVNTNTWMLYSSLGSLSNRWWSSNSVLSANIAYARADIYTLSNRLSSFHGSNILAGTINSNSIDVDTWFAMTNGSLASGGTMNFDAGVITSDGSGNLTATTVKAGLLDNWYSSGPYGYSPVANGDGSWTWMAMVTITNTETAYSLSNSMFSSASLTLLDTNFNFAISNYLGTFTNVMQVTVELNGGGGGMSPQTNIATLTWFSTNAGVNWTTNFPNPMTNICEVAVTAASTNYGRVEIFSAERPELDNRTNDMRRQYLYVREPVNNAEAASKYYVDVTTANVAGSRWKNSGGAYLFGPNNVPVLELYESALYYSTNAWLQSSGTNWLLNIAATNFYAGWQVQMSTNLALTDSFNTFTNYTLATNSGIATFTIAKASTPATYSFFRIVSPQTPGIVVKSPFVLPITTPTNSTATTWGHGAGVLLVDTNYVYVSVGTNQWKRAALSSW